MTPDSRPSACLLVWVEGLGRALLRASYIGAIGEIPQALSVPNQQLAMGFVQSESR